MNGSATGPSSSRLPRTLHPGAWWLWAIALGAAATRTTNPLVLILLMAAAALVVSARKSEAPWAAGFRTYALLALIIVFTRVLFRVLLDGRGGEHLLFTLPELPLPKAAAGIRIGGPVSAEALLSGLYDGLRLGALLLCVGAANVLSDPKRLLKATPSALHEVSVAVVVALSVAPQLIESGQRVRRARKLRGGAKGRFHLVRQVLIPVLTDALDRSLLLAAAMDSRGFGRRGDTRRRHEAVTGFLMLGALVGLGIGAYGLLDATAPWYLAWPMLGLGVSTAALGLWHSGRRVTRTRYRPDRWRWEETAVVACGLTTLVVFLQAGQGPAGLGLPSPIVSWPTLPLAGLLGCVAAALPAVVAPPVTAPLPGTTVPSANHLDVETTP